MQKTTFRIIAAALAASAIAPATVHAQTGCGGLLQPKCPVPAPAPAPSEPAPPAEPATLTLTPKSVTRTYHREVVTATFSGRVGGRSEFSGLYVDLVGRVPAYGAAATLEPKRIPVRADGTFSEKISTTVTATVQAQLIAPRTQSGEQVLATSPVRTLHVRAARPTLDVSAAPGHQILLAVNFPGPTSVSLRNDIVKPRLGGTRAYFYGVPRRGRVATRIASAPLRSGGCSQECTRVATAHVGVNRVRHYVGALACVPRPVFVGIEQQTFAKCGARRVRVR